MEETEAVVRRYVAACNGEDKEAVFVTLHPEVAMYEPDMLPGAVSVEGLEAVRRYLDRFDTHWSSFRWEPLEMRVAGRRALMRSNLHLTGRQSGIETHREWIYVFEVRDGKLYRQFGFDDITAAESALAQGGP